MAWLQVAVRSTRSASVAINMLVGLSGAPFSNVLHGIRHYLNATDGAYWYIEFHRESLPTHHRRSRSCSHEMHLYVLLKLSFIKLVVSAPSSKLPKIHEQHTSTSLRCVSPRLQTPPITDATLVIITMIQPSC